MSHLKHPAAYSAVLLPIFAELLRETANVLDPMGGSGKLARIKEFGYQGHIVANELEPEWANGYAIDEWHFGDAAAMTWAADGAFDAICTSPTYANRMADLYSGRDNSRRVTYRIALQRIPHPASTCGLQWGARYRFKHQEIYRECYRVLKAGGLMIVNVSDHIRAGVIVPVAEWHRMVLEALGLAFVTDIPVHTPRMGFGQNREKRVECEHVFLFRKV